ncbi:MAG: MBL fold metallo-hydrolase [Oscillospiraceae bacterium]|nr:MBL fold metallo-hydrolase [Oscillospiraceae bacterium]
MKQPIEVTGGPGGSVFLIEGSEKTALYDAGMAYCAPVMMEKLDKALKGRTLDYMLVSHSHYDHIAAMPYLRQRYPQLKVFGSQHAHDVLERQGALELMRRLNEEAAEYYGAPGAVAPYDDADLHIDVVVKEGDLIGLGDISIRVLENPGHTKCCLAFVAGEEYIFPSETTCYKSRSGKVYPAFLSGCADSLTSLYHCSKQHIPKIMAPHYGLVTDSTSGQYWQACLKSILESRDFIVEWGEMGKSEDEILNAYEVRFRDDEIRAEQPNHAFDINTRAMIRTVLHEHARGISSPMEGHPLP